MTKPEAASRPALLEAAAFAGMLVFGLVMALVGALLPVLAERLRFDLGAAGGLFLGMNFAMLVAVFALGPAIDRYGMKPPIAGGALLVAGAMAWIAGASSYASLQGAVALLGAGGGALNGATNTLVADLHEDPKRKAAALNLLGVFFGVGALMMPFAMGSLLEALGLRTLLVAGAVLCATVGVAAAVLRYPAPKAPARLPVSEMPGLLRVALVPAMGALLFFQSGNEFLMGGYLSTFLTQGLGATVERASLLLALMWGSILVARIGLSRLLRKADPHWTVIVSAAVASAACALIASAGSPAGAAPAVALAGVSFAGIFPTVLGVAGARFESRSGTVIGLLLTMALVGGMSVPWAAGHLAAAAGPRAIFWMAAVNAAATCGLAGVVRRLDR